MAVSRRWLLAGLGVAGLVGLGAIAYQVSSTGRVPGQPSIGGPFTLVDGDGKPVTDRDFRGRWLLVYFGYTSCPDVCPTTLRQVGLALDDLGKRADRITPVFITVDPARDTPAQVKAYAAFFSPRLVGLTGTEAQIHAVAGAYRVFFQKHATGPGPFDYTMDHSSVLYLMGPDGQFVAPLRADQEAKSMAEDLSRAMAGA